MVCFSLCALKTLEVSQVPDCWLERRLDREHDHGTRLARWWETAESSGIEPLWCRLRKCLEKRERDGERDRQKDIHTDRQTEDTVEERETGK
jgi:hypothetical protein